MPKLIICYLAESYTVPVFINFFDWFLLFKHCRAAGVKTPSKLITFECFACKTIARV